MSSAVQVHLLSKQFRQSALGSRRTLRTWLSTLGRRPATTGFVQALDRVSFTLDRGEVLGIVGTNGSGKSTLLRLVGGVGLPDEGVIETRGRFGALLELGIGGYDDLSGRDNIIVGSVIAGLSYEEALANVDQIANFAEIEEHLDSPLRTYSTGMQMRLAFAAIVFSYPDILLVDEVLAVGDLSFHQKCLKKIWELREQGTCILLASHDLEQVRGLCDRVLWLENGQQRMLDEPDAVIDAYLRNFGDATRLITPAAGDGSDINLPLHEVPGLKLGESKFGSQEVHIERVRIQEEESGNDKQFEQGQPVTFLVEYVVVREIPGMILGVKIANDRGQVCVDVNSGTPDADRRVQAGRGLATLQVNSLDLRPGDYSVSIGLYESAWAYAYDYHWNAYELTVKEGTAKTRRQYPDCCWQIKKENETAEATTEAES